MDILEAIKTRKSIRGYKSEPVSKDVIKDILDTAVCAPSAMNTQPWEFTVIAGDVLKKINRANMDRLRSGAAMKPEHQVVGWTSDSIYRGRQVELAKQIFQIMDIPREDKEKRLNWMERGFRFFDAPAAIILSVDRSLSDEGPLLDIGAVMQNICLAAQAYGLGTCIEDQGVIYADVIREYTNLPSSKKIIIAIAIGYPDWERPENTVRSTRETAEHMTAWCGFD